MEGKLKIATSDCQGIDNSEHDMRSMLEEVHMIALQETWLYGDIICVSS